MTNAAQSVVVFGEALVDDFGSEQVVGGAPFNVARHLAAFGLAPLMITRLGQDDNGASVRAEVSRFGMTQSGLQWDDQHPTGRVLVERDATGHRFIILPDQAYDYIATEPALRAMAGVTADALYFGTLAQRGASARASLFALLAASKARRFLDLNVRAGQVHERCVFESLHAATVVKVNEEELADLFAWYTHTRPPTRTIDSKEVAAACRTLIRVFTLEGLLVTLGDKGAVYFGADGSRLLSQAGSAPPRVIDTVGAGDAFSAVFMLGQALHWPLAQTLARANEFAAAVCGIAGAVPQQDGFYLPWTTRWFGGIDAAIA
ncbi:MAG: PfkB family carbohydrate kinase [Pseudomonadota bacterium]|nr:PfkB family carbohydrate kinase [Pseudomonadota bacterium]